MQYDDRCYENNQYITSYELHVINTFNWQQYILILLLSKFICQKSTCINIQKKCMLKMKKIVILEVKWLEMCVKLQL